MSTYNVELSDQLIDQIVEIVCAWSGETGTDYMGVTVEIRRLLVDASKPKDERQ